MNVSKALSDVWKWREEVHRKTEGMTGPQLIAYFRGASKRLADKTGRPLDLPRRHATGGATRDED
jgi:hypothetical protein